MSHKMQLSSQRENTVINGKSKKQEASLAASINRLVATLGNEYPQLKFNLIQQLHLSKVINNLHNWFPEVKFCECFESSSMRPDGGVLYIEGNDGQLCPILISEKKNQGTNDERIKQGKKRQAQGNAIERLGKNVIGLRAALMNESIFPFVCFGDGCDFAETSSIVDRVKTIAMFGNLNEIHLHNEGPGGKFNRGTYYFRVEEWTEDEMYEKSLEIARRSILYYISKYGEQRFTQTSLFD